LRKKGTSQLYVLVYDKHFYFKLEEGFAGTGNLTDGFLGLLRKGEHLNSDYLMI
jgi:hypothetical protein